MKKKIKTICSRHEDIVYFAENILKLNPTKEIKSFIKRIIKEVKLAKKSGERMENRLQDYKLGIEMMGFKRK